MAQFKTQQTMSKVRPPALVVCCADGRIQDALDEYLKSRFGTAPVDRILIAGGPGAFLYTNGPAPWSFAPAERAEVAWNEIEFLISAHQVKTLLLVFHGTVAEDHRGDFCGDYCRLFPNLTVKQLLAQQKEDGAKVTAQASSKFPTVAIETLWLLADGDGRLSVFDQPVIE